MDTGITEEKKNITIQDDWYKIDGEWYHCVTLNHHRYVNGVLQEESRDGQMG